ncbi:MAG: tRNA pseudouridine synthase A, partial [Clostridia bacterium]|nr:tRNA pseudouridine synthase A [Clostridia bacterium]
DLAALHARLFQQFAANVCRGGIHFVRRRPYRARFGRNQVGNFKCETDLSCSEILNYLNEYLPADVKVLSVEECDMRFHSRLNAVRKTYSYTISFEKSDVFRHRFMYYTKDIPDIKLMQKACDELTGTHDFQGFSSVKKTKKSTVRTLYSVDIEQNGNELKLIFCGNGFLYNMVRILAGTIFDIGLGKKSLSDIKNCFETHDRAFAGTTLPPQGLCLENVEY